MLVTSVKAVDGEHPPPPPPPIQHDETAESELAQEAHQWAQHHKKSRLVDPSPVQPPTSNKSTRRLIKVDFSALPMDDEEDDDEMEEERRGEDEVGGGDGGVPGAEEPDLSGPPTNRWQRTAYDLATQCPWAGRGCSRRRHTVVVCQSGTKGSLSQPQSRPHSRQTDTPGSEESIATTLPEMTWSRSSLQDDLLHSKQWQEECLSLTLEEIVHIRSVLTKAELESLPVEGHVKEDAEKRKVCFLCMKTRFGIFGPWGQVCKLCKRTVCTKCCSKMRIPTEHFSHVPVVALSPNLLSPCDSEDSFPKALVNKLMWSGGPLEQAPGPRTGVGSAPNSPKLNRSAPPSQMSASLISDGPISLPSSSPAYTPSDKWRMAREKALGRRGRDKAEKLKGLQMTVCHDCKTMVLQIIKSSRTSRNNAIRNLTLDLSPVY